MQGIEQLSRFHMLGTVVKSEIRCKLCSSILESPNDALEMSLVYLTQDLDAAAGLRALQKRIHLVPGAVHDFLQAGGISAAVTILCSQPLHAELRDAAVTLLQAVLQRLPAEASAAFL